MTFHWKVAHNQTDKRRVLEDSLPPDEKYSYVVTFFSISESSNIIKESKFSATVNVNVCTTDDLQSFLQDLNSISGVSYKMNFPDNKNAKSVLSSGSRFCSRNVRKRKLSSDSDDVKKDKTAGKNTNCPSKIKFKLSKHLHTRNCSGHNLQLQIEHHHNHHIDTAINVRMQPVSNDTKNMFIQYFSEGQSAASAYHSHKAYLEATYKEDYTRISANRAFCPDYAWVSNFSSKFLLDKFGQIVGPEAMQKAHEYCQQYNTLHGKQLAHVVQKDNGHYFVVILDDFILRAHQNLPQAKDICLLDVTGSLDRVDSRLARFLTVSPSGGIPLGNIIVSSESEQLLTEAFTAFQDMLPEDSWNGRGRLGPTLMMTDDCSSEIAAVKNVWPEAKNILCQFHLLQAVWRWLMAGAHGIPQKHRAHLFYLFRSLVYSKSTAEFEEAREKFMEDDTLNKYRNFEDHITRSYLHRIEAWATHVRLEQNYPNHNINTTNYVESSFRVLKDREFNRTKCYNLPDLVQHMLQDKSSHYVKKLTDFGNGIFSATNRNSQYNSSGVLISKDDIIEVYTNKVFYVKSQSQEDTWYQVDMVSGFCECSVGSSRAPCKHKHSIKHHYNISEFTSLPVDAGSKAMWHFIALGRCEDRAWYRDDNESDSVNVEQYIHEHLPETENEVTEENNDNNDNDGDNDCEDGDNNDDDRDNNDDDGDENDEGTNDDDRDNNYDDLRDNDANDQEENQGQIDNEANTDFDTEWNEFHNIVTQLGEKFKGYWNDENFRKAFRKFKTKCSTMRNTNQNTLIRHFHDFAQDGKRKNSFLIPVQNTAPPRRVNKERGRGVAQDGRRHKEVQRRTEIFITETEENVWHSLPSKKRPRLQLEHSLSSAVSNNRHNAKKH